MSDGGPDEVADVIEVDLSEWRKLKVVELRKRVAEVGLDTKGTKAELIARVEKYLNEQEADLLEEEDLGEEEEEGNDEEGAVEDGEPAEEEEKEGAEKETAQSNGQLSTAAASDQPIPPAVAAVKPSSTSSEPSLNPPSTKLSDSERVLLRSERFGGNESVVAKKAARAQRFGVQLGKRSAEDLEKLKKRSERFGCSTSPVISGIEDQEKKKKRVDRFGDSAVSPSAMGVDEQKKRRAERFGKSK